MNDIPDKMKFEPLHALGDVDVLKKLLGLAVMN